MEVLEIWRERKGYEINDQESEKYEWTRTALWDWQVAYATFEISDNDFKVR